MPHSSSYPPKYGGYQGAPPGPGPDPYGPVDQEGVANLLTPKTVVQLAVWILMFGLGAGLSGLILFAIYQGQVNNLRSELLDSQEELRKTLEQQIGRGPAPEESPNLNVSGAGPTPVDPLKEMVQTNAPAIVGVNGVDSEGKSVSGTGFVVNSTEDGTWVLTNYHLVAGVETVDQLSIRNRTSSLIAEVYETDPGRDLALIIYRVPSERSLRFSRVTEPEEGDQVFVLGNDRAKPYATGIAATLTGVTSGSLTLDADIPESYLGGPVLDVDGRVVGVLTNAAPEGGVAAPIELACSRVIRCPSSGGSSSGTGADPTPGASPSPRPDTEQTPEPQPGDVNQPPASNPNTADVPIG